MAAGRARCCPPVVILTSSTDRARFGSRLDAHVFIAKADICSAAIARLARRPERTAWTTAIPDAPAICPRDSKMKKAVVLGERCYLLP
jgi:hypothetical protein